jgi:predicted rRNA methylase YqxC with S4 and FtsJ domains
MLMLVALRACEAKKHTLTSRGSWKLGAHMKRYDLLLVRALVRTYMLRAGAGTGGFLRFSNEEHSLIFFGLFS